MSIIRRLLGCFAVCCALVSAAPAQNARVPSSPGEIKLSLAPAVKRVTPAVVNVYAARIIENRVPLFDDPVFRRFFGGSNGPREQVRRSLGSGVVVDASGLVVTNNHVIENADQIKVAPYLIWMVRGFASSTFGKVNESTPSRSSAPMLL